MDEQMDGWMDAQLRMAIDGGNDNTMSMPQRAPHLTAVRCRSNGDCFPFRCQITDLARPTRHET